MERKGADWYDQSRDKTVLLEDKKDEDTEEGRMIRLAMIADDLTGAMDTAAGFFARGADVRVFSFQERTDFFAGGEEVSVIDAETRHLAPEEAYLRVAALAKKAVQAGATHLYKKTDSALRGNIGSELAAMLCAGGGETVNFVPAFPQMGRTTKGGIHYVEGSPVAQSVFGQDPFEPVKDPYVLRIIGAQTEVPAVACGVGEFSRAPGICVYDAETEEDMEGIADGLGAGGLRLCAGCAGFAQILARRLFPEKRHSEVQPAKGPLWVICGSVNPVTIKQLLWAQARGAVRLSLAPRQKLESAWLLTDEGDRLAAAALAAGKRADCIIVDTLDQSRGETWRLAQGRDMTLPEMRERIAEVLGGVVKKLLEAGLEGTLMCTGGDVLQSVLYTLGAESLRLQGEIAPGVVRAGFLYGEEERTVLTKSGGFGGQELLERLVQELKKGGTGKT